MVRPALRILTGLGGEDRHLANFESYGGNPYFFQSYATLFQPIFAKRAPHVLILIQSYAGIYKARPCRPRLTSAR
jgi:hypothetical protein